MTLRDLTVADFHAPDCDQTGHVRAFHISVYKKSAKIIRFDHRIPVRDTVLTSESMESLADVG